MSRRPTSSGFAAPAATPEPASRTLKLGTGLNYHALEWNAAAPDDRTVLLVHGFLDCAWVWEDVGAQLARAGFHVVAPDMRGHGDSERVGSGGYYHFMDYVADLAEVVRTTSRSHLSIVGHSMGGAIAGYFAGTFPTLIERLAILEGFGTPTWEMTPEGVATWIAMWVAKQSRHEKRGYADLAEAAAKLRQRDPRLAEPMALRLAARSTRTIDDGRLAFKHDPLHLTRGPYPFTHDVLTRFLGAITCPTLFVDAADSELAMVTPAVQAERRALVQNARHAVLADAGHAMMRHQPEALATLIAAFLAE